MGPGTFTREDDPLPVGKCRSASAAAALARAEAAGVCLRLRPDGGVRMEAAAPPPADVLADLRRWRDDVALLLVARDGPPERGAVPAGEHDAAEAAAMAQHYAAPPSADPYRPGDPDPLRDGLLAGALRRLPSWADPAAIPPPGAWCAGCSRHRPGAGGRWWCEADAPRGWRCRSCHPPDHLPAAALRELRT